MQEGDDVERPLAVVLVVLVEERDVGCVYRALPDEEVNPLVRGVAAEQRVVEIEERDARRAHRRPPRLPVPV